MTLPSRITRVPVVAGVIRDQAGNILIALRHASSHQGGLWEFSGGKQEPDEARIDALNRELLEELDVAVDSAIPLIQLNHDYRDKSVSLDVWEVLDWHGTARGKEGQALRWVPPNSLRKYDFPAANKPIIKAALLPRVIYLPERAQPITVEDAHAFIGTSMRTQYGSASAAENESSGLSKFVRARFFMRDKSQVDPRLENEPRLNVISFSQFRDISNEFRASADLIGVRCMTEQEMRAAANDGADFLIWDLTATVADLSRGSAIYRDVVERFVATLVVPIYLALPFASRHLAAVIDVGCQGIVIDGRQGDDFVFLREQVDGEIKSAMATLGRD